MDSSHVSSIIENAEILSGQPSLAVYRWTDMSHFLDSRWRYIYEQLAMVDPFYYGEIRQVTNEVFSIPLQYTNNVWLFRAKDPVTFDRWPLRKASNRERTGSDTYDQMGRTVFIHNYLIQGMPIWIVLQPIPPELTWPRNNRTWKLLENTPNQSPPPTRYLDYDITYGIDPNHPEWETFGSIIFTNKRDPTIFLDRGLQFNRLGQKIVSFILSCDTFFITWEDLATGDWTSTLYEKPLESPPPPIQGSRFEGSSMAPYNCFDYNGRGTHIKFIEANWDKYTGGTVTLLDQDDLDENNQPKCKTDIGAFVDTRVFYPNSVVLDLLVANIGYKLMLKNMTQRPAVLEALASAKAEFEKFIKVDKSAWGKIELVNPMYSWNYW